MNLYNWIGFIFSFLVIYAIIYRLYVKRGAKKIYQMHKNLYSSPHEYREVNPSDFPHIPTEHYDKTQRWLEENGFRLLANIENVTITRQVPNMRTYSRWMTHESGTIGATVYDIRPRGKFRLLQWVGLVAKDFRTVEIETEFHNRSFFVTANCKENAKTADVPEITRNYFSHNTSLDVLLASHLNYLATRGADDPGYQPVKIFTLKEAIDSQHRQEDIKIHHRKSTGYITDAEMTQIAGPRLAKGGEKVMKEIKKIQEEDR